MTQRVPRPPERVSQIPADLARHAAGERPAWVSAATWRRLRVLAEGLRTDALAAVAAEGAVRTAASLGTARDTLRLWRAEGWLRATQEAAQGDG